MRTAIFDLDGTLVDSAPDIVDAANRALADVGLGEIGLKAGRDMIGGGARGLVRQAVLAAGGNDGDDAFVDRAFERFMIHYGAGSVSKSVLYPGVRETLEKLGSLGIPMGVCTNKPHGISLAVLEGLDLMRHFRAVVGGDALPERKPAAGHLRETIARTEPATKSAIMIGDSATDVAAARNANVPVIVVSYGYTKTPAAALGADAVIDRMADLPDAMDRLWGPA